MNERLRYALGGIALGQLVSLCMTGASFASSALSDKGVDAPVTQSLIFYILLALVFGGLLLHRGQKLQVSWYWYILLALVDVEGNFLGGSKPILGDTLVIGGTIFYAMSNVGEEFCVKNRDRVEVVAMLGIFGALISTIQLVILERKELESLDWSYSIVLLFLGFGLSMFAFYTLVPFLLKMTGATLFNLSLLTSDMWAVLIRIFFYHKAVDWLYYVAFAVVVVGLTIYSFYSDKVTTIVIENGANETIPYTQLNEEREPNIPGIIVTPS